MKFIMSKVVVVVGMSVLCLQAEAEVTFRSLFYNPSSSNVIRARPVIRAKPATPAKPALPVERSLKPVPRPERQIMPTDGTENRNPGSKRTKVIEGCNGEAGTNSCSGHLVIVGSRNRCEELEYDKDFLDTMNGHGLTCIRNAAQEAFGFTPNQVQLKTGNGQVSASRRVAGSARRSLHSVGRALDIFEISFNNGESVRMHKNNMVGADKTFYHAFQGCWEATVLLMRGQGVAGRGGDGTVTYENNRAHHDHIHISLPALSGSKKLCNLAGT